MIAPQNFESAGGLPVGKVWLHLSSLALVSVNTYNNLYSVKLHYGGRFTDSPNKQYVDGDVFFVDMLDIDDFKVDLLNTVMCSLGYEDDDELLLYYKIPLKSLDVGLKRVVSDTDFSNKNFIGYVKNHKIMDFYLVLVEKTESFGDEDGQSDSESEDANDLVDEEHLVEEVEVNMNKFNFQLDGEDETDFIDPIQPHVNVTEDDLEVLDFDSLESDQEDVPENARSRGLRKLRKKHMSYGIRNNFYIGKEFANRDLAKERIRAYAVETRMNLDFKVNDKRRIRVICNGVVPTLNSKNEYVDKIQGPNQDISEKGKGIMQDAKEDKLSCPLLLYLSKGDKSKWLVKTFKDEHKCLQSRQIKHCTSNFLSKQITDLITMNPQIPIKAIQEQMQKKYHVYVSKHKSFRAKAKTQVHLRGDVEIQYSLLWDYANELQKCNPDTTVKIDVYGEEDHEKPTRMFKRIYVCLGALKRGFKESGRELLGLDGAFMRGQYSGQMLTAVGMDANNGIYPIAYGIVESENQYSWTWFLTCLGDDFDLYTNSNFTFITDRQKGLVPTIAKLFPAAEHRVVECLYKNIVDIIRMKLMGLTMKCSPDVLTAASIWNFKINNVCFGTGFWECNRVYDCDDSKASMEVLSTLGKAWVCSNVCRKGRHISLVLECHVIEEYVFVAPVYAADQKLKKELQFSLVDNSKLNDVDLLLKRLKQNVSLLEGLQGGKKIALRLYLFKNILLNGPYVPMTTGQRKPEGQWTANERKAATLDQRLKSLILSVLPDDQVNSVINCKTAKSTWEDLILYHEGPSNVKESRVMDLKLCYNTFKYKEDETLTQTFIRYKALMNENMNHVKEYELASLFGKLKYEENLIDSIYESKKKKSLVTTTLLSTAFFLACIVKDFQDSPDDEEDTRSSQEYLNDLEEEY
ncbi:transposase, MuDR [Tanacetum coccineum]